jgi:phosphoribosylformylglycinamidine (FGAM) synthase-like enzyme
MAEDQFDPVKFRTAMDNYLSKYRLMIGESQEVMIKVASGLSLEERQSILERYNNLPKRSLRGRD